MTRSFETDPNNASQTPEALCNQLGGFLLSNGIKEVPTETAEEIDKVVRAARKELAKNGTIPQFIKDDLQYWKRELDNNNIKWR